MPPTTTTTTTTHATNQHHNHIFRFLNLPAELRNEVYKYLFTAPSSSGIIEISSRNLVTHRESGPSKSCRCYVWTNREDNREDNGEDNCEDASSFPPLQVLFANRQIHDEAAAAFYGINCFQMNTHCVRCFLAGIGTSAAHVRKLRLLVLHPDDDALHLFGSSNSATASTAATATATTATATATATVGTAPAYAIFSEHILLSRLMVQWVYEPRGPDEAARYIYERMLGWIEAVGVRQQDRFAALERIVEGKGPGPSAVEVRGALRRLMEMEGGEG